MQHCCKPSVRSTSIQPMRRAILLGSFFFLSACAVGDTVNRLDRCPPPEVGRPGWVRASAGTGAWIGGIGGGIVSVVLLPITWPLSLVASDGLGDASRTELMVWPVSGGAAIGHCLLGLPTDTVDFVFRRAWVGEEMPANTYELVPMEPPMGIDERKQRFGAPGGAGAEGASGTEAGQRPPK